MKGFLLSLSSLLGFADLWQNYLEMGTPEKVIIGIVVFALFATLLYFLYRILDGIAVIFKGIFWFLKSIVFLIVVLLFSLAWLIFICPFGFFRYKKFTEVIEIYKITLRRLKYFFYPKAKKDLIMTKEEIAKKITEKDKKGMLREKKEQVSTSKEKKPSEKSDEIEEIPKFHCSNCGAEMPPSMVTLLQKGNAAFCEACGQKFKMEGGIPYPTDH
ncbi:hypothetical protein [Candidatus Harpocratesius sp.]